MWTRSKLCAILGSVLSSSVQRLVSAQDSSLNDFIVVFISLLL
jgi:hypothetical protein